MLCPETSTHSVSPPVSRAVALQHSYPRLSSGRNPEGVGHANCQSEKRTGVVSCTYPSRASPTYCGCCTSFRRFPPCPALLVRRYAVGRYVTPHRRRSPSRRPRLCTTHLRLRRASGQFRLTRARLPQVCWSTYSTQRRERSNQARIGISGCLGHAGTVFSVQGRWQET